MRTITALRAARRGRVAVELDDMPWRTLPVEVVGRAGLSVGLSLDRPTARLVRQELRRAEALAVAKRTLATRDLSEGALRARLAARVPGTAGREAVDTLVRAGLVDDARFARNRATALAERAYGDAAIRHDLERRGVRPEQVEEAVSALAPETARARAVVVRRGDSAKTARFLASRGFGEEALEAAGFASFL
jgi:SOS response regulatory protein OraA/RecX